MSLEIIRMSETDVMQEALFQMLFNLALFILE